MTVFSQDAGTTSTDGNPGNARRTIFTDDDQPDHSYAAAIPEDNQVPALPATVSTATPLPPWEVAHRTRIATITHVPPAAKASFERLMTDLWWSAVNRTNVDDDTPFLLIYIVARCTLFSKASPPGLNENTAEIVKRRMDRWRNGEIGTLWLEAVKAQAEGNCKRQKKRTRQRDFEGERVKSQADLNAARCHRLIELGQFSRAAEALNSEGIDFDSREAEG